MKKNIEKINYNKLVMLYIRYNKINNNLKLIIKHYNII